MKVTRREIRNLIETYLFESVDYGPGVYFAGKRLVGKATHGFLLIIDNDDITGYHGGPGSYYNKNIAGSDY